MADSCAQYVNADDLKAAKESILHIEHVATSKDANGDHALSVSDPIRGQNYTNTTLDGLFADIGFKPVNGSFEDGGELKNRWDVLLYETNGSFYQWMGTLPHTVPAGSSPFDSSGQLISGWVDQTDLTLRTQLAQEGAGYLVDDSNVKVKQPLPGTIVRNQHDKNAEFVTSGDFQAPTDGVTDAAPALNAALNGGNRTVRILKGTYLVKSYLRVYSNTTIIMEQGCVILNDNQVGESVFLNGEFGNANYASGYNGESNIVISGGCIDNSPKKSKSQQTNAIGIAHATNVLIDNVVFKNNYKSHFIEINSSKDVVIRNCKFDTLDPADAAGNRSMINIDYAFAEGFPPFGSYDGTVCKNVIVDGCAFYNGDSAVDSHSSPAAGAYHSNIAVLNCHIENMVTSGVSPRFWADSKIDNCTFVNAGIRTIRAWSAKRLKTSKCSFVGGGSQYAYSMAVDDVTKVPEAQIISECTFDSVSGACILMTGGNHMIVSDCIAKGCGGNLVSQASGTSGLVVDGCESSGSTSTGSPFQFAGDSVVLSGSVVVSGAYQYAVNLQGSNSNVVVDGCRLAPGTIGTTRVTSLCKIDGKWCVSLADNAAISLLIGDQSGQGIVTISGNWLQSGSTINGCYQVRGGAGTELVQKYYALSPSPSLLTGPLTGTTGPSGVISLSAASDNKIYLENRTGSSRFFVIDMVAF